MRRYIFTVIGVLAGFLAGALAVGAFFSGVVSNDVILLAELLFGTVGAIVGGTLGWFGSTEETPKGKQKKR